MNKICVYTCITGDYDKVNELPFKEKGVDYYLFTNNDKINSKTWNVVYIEDKKLDNITLSRKIKMIGNDITNKYEITVWIDGATYIKKSIIEFIDKYCDLKKYSLIGFKHSIRNCVYEEAKACIYYNREKIENIKKLLNYLEKRKYPHQNGLIEAAILVKNTKDSILTTTMNDWFNMFIKYCQRDQLSFNYCAYKNKLKFKLLDMNAFDNEYFGRMDHNAIPTIDNFYLYFGDKSEYENYNIDSQIQGKYDIVEGIYCINVVAPIDGNKITLELNKSGGLKVRNLTINNSKESESIFIENFLFDDCNCFVGNNSVVIMTYNYKKGQKITINIDMNVIEISEYKKIIDNICLEKIELKKIINNQEEKIRENLEIIDILKNENNKILNSKSYKILDYLKKIKTKFNKGKS